MPSNKSGLRNIVQLYQRFPSACSPPLWPSGHHVRRAVRLHAEPHPEGEDRSVAQPPQPNQTKPNQTALLHLVVSSVPPGSSGIPARSLPDQGERLPHLRRHATRRPVRWPSHPRENRLRPDDLCRQGEFTLKSGPARDLLRSPRWPLIHRVRSATAERTNAGSSLAGFRSTSATAAWTWRWTRPSSCPSTSCGRWLSLSDRFAHLVT